MKRAALTVGTCLLVFAAIACKKTEKASLYETAGGLASGVSVQTEDQRSEEYKNFAAKIRGISTPAQINQLLWELDEKYKKGELKTTEVKFFAAQMIPFRNFRSLVYKAKPLFQKDYDASGKLPPTNATHHVAVSAVMAAVAGQRVLLPYTNASTAMDYVTDPIPLGDPKFDHTGQGRDLQSVDQYIDTDKIQSDLLCTQFRKDMELAVDRISKLDFGDGHVTVDLALALGQNVNAFSEPQHKQDRYVLIGEPERAGTLAGLMAAMHNIYVGCSYTIKDITYAIEALGWTAGMDGAINRLEVAGATAAVRFNLLRTGTLPAHLKSHVATRLALRQRQDREVSQRIMTPGQLLPQGKQLMVEALAHLKASVHYSYLAYLMAKEGSGRGVTSEMYPVLDWGRLKPFARIINLNMTRLLSVAGISPESVGGDIPAPGELVKNYLAVSQKTGGNRAVKFKSLVDNATTTVYVDRFYLNPPSNVRNFMPVGFDDNPGKQYAAVAGGKSFALGSAGVFGNGNSGGAGNRQGTTRNYAWGMATSWQHDQWSQYFSEIGRHGVRGEIKILAESLGGPAIAAAMAPFVF